MLVEAVRLGLPTTWWLRHGLNHFSTLTVVIHLLGGLGERLFRLFLPTTS